MPPVTPDDPIRILNPEARSSVVVVCEHASRHIPPEFRDLGLDRVARHSHIAWDPGALAVAEGLASRLDATLVAATVSRLVYDCNRPPAAPDAMPARSEAIDIPENVGLTEAQRAARTAAYYEPFRKGLAATLASTPDAILVTIHSFTPVFHGQPRAVEIGILHDVDTRLADAMMQCARSHTSMQVARNRPYGPEDGVTHTLQEHAIRAGHLNVMIEIRNDLIATAQQQDAMAECLAAWVSDAMAVAQLSTDAQC
ncbi:N-formylglutamate amidohydrolase [Roseivivax sp. CAU 1753]